MKLFAIILSIFTITMSAMPCDDEVDISAGEITVMNANSHTENHGSVDLCTPFCTCVCCASLVVEPSFDQETKITETIHTDLISFYTFSYTSDYLDRIFQPPQV